MERYRILENREVQYHNFKPMQLFNKELWRDIVEITPLEDGIYPKFVLEDLTPDLEKIQADTDTKATKENISNTQEALDSLTTDYPKFEKDTFWIQELEARAYVLDNNTTIPFISKLAETRGVTILDMVDKIILNADALKEATATIVGNYQASL